MKKSKKRMLLFISLGIFLLGIITIALTSSDCGYYYRNSPPLTDCDCIGLVIEKLDPATAICYGINLGQ